MFSFNFVTTLKFIALVLLVGLYSCNNSSGPERNIVDKPVTESRTLFPATATGDSLSAALRSIPQQFEIDASRDTLIKGTSGVSLHIPAGIFVDENQQVVTNVKITLVEAKTMADFIYNDLHTESDGELLESAGMFYVNAEANGKPVSIKEGEAMLIQTSTQYQVGDMQVFYGNYNPEGKLNWTPVGKTVGVLDNSMIAYPIATFVKPENRQSLAMISGMINPNNVKAVLAINAQLDGINNPKYEDTYIATHEFWMRFCVLSFGAPLNSDSTVFRQVMDIYKAGINDDLYKADEKVIELLTPHATKMFLALQDSVRQDSIAELTMKKDGPNAISGIFDRGRNSIVYNVSKLLWDYVVKLPEAKLTRPIDFKAYGITSSTTKADLVANGYSGEDATRLLFYFKQRQNFKLDNALVDKQQEALKYTMSVKKMGWVNIDRFLNDSSSKETNFVVKISGGDSLRNTRLNLIIPERGICIANTFFEKGEYSFTKKGTAYRKLPLGMDAYLIALSTHDGRNYLGIKKIKIPASGAIALDMEAGTSEEIKSKIERTIKKSH